MKMKVKAKAHKPGHNLHHARITFSKNGGATVHTQVHGSKDNPYPPEEESGSFGSTEEALHHVGKLTDADVELNEPNAGAAEEAAEVKKGNG